jgi:hypothetical protein
MGSVFASSAALADAANMKLVARCLKDNADAGTAVEVVTKYCACVNNKMSRDETLSISAWEKTHVAEQKACDKEAGWK